MDFDFADKSFFLSKLRLPTKDPVHMRVHSICVLRIFFIVYNFKHAFA